MKNKIIKIFFIAILFPLQTHAATYFEDNFDGYAGDPTTNGWTYGSKFSVSNTEGRGGGRCFIVHTGTPMSGAYNWRADHDPNPNGTFAEGYIRFSFKIVNHGGSSYGTKFLKLHGEQNGDTNYANYTMQYISGGSAGAFCGNGSGTENDIGCNFRYYNSTTPSSCTHSSYVHGSGNPVVNDGNWHTYETYIKENTDGNYDGEIRVWFDGVQYLEVIGIRMRNDENIRNIETLDLFGYQYDDNDPDDDWYLYYDDIIVSDTYNGVPDSPTDTTAPSAPSGLAVS